MARWQELNPEQQSAILAFTREAPNDEPNGPEEQAWVDILALWSVLPDTDVKRCLGEAMAAACRSSADQIRALRLAFGLGEDGVTPSGEG